MLGTNTGDRRARALSIKMPRPAYVEAEDKYSMQGPTVRVRLGQHLRCILREHLSPRLHATFGWRNGSIACAKTRDEARSGARTRARVMHATKLGVSEGKWCPYRCKLRPCHGGCNNPAAYNGHHQPTMALLHGALRRPPSTNTDPTPFEARCECWPAGSLIVKLETCIDGRGTATGIQISIALE